MIRPPRSASCQQMSGSAIQSHGQTTDKRSWPAPRRFEVLAMTCGFTVGDTGIEPVTSSVSGKRSPAELIAQVRAEVETGFEPVYTALQAVASPLGHSTNVGRAFGGLRADDGTRTRDPHLGKVMRYQLRYVRVPPEYRVT